MIDLALLPAFRPYLSPEAAEAVAMGQENILAVGVITEDGHTCGAAAVVCENQVLILRSLYVDPQMRRQGAATLLLDTLEEKLKIQKVNWVAPEAEQDGLKAFLQNRGFSVAVSESSIMRLDCDAMKQLTVCRRAFLPGYQADPNVIPMAAVTEAEMEELLSDASIPQVLRPDNFPPEVLDSPYSLAYRYKGVIAAYFLAVPIADGAVVKSAVSRKQFAHGGAFFQLAYASMHRSIPFLPPKGGSYWLEAISKEAETLAQFLSKDHYERWTWGSASL